MYVFEGFIAKGAKDLPLVDRGNQQRIPNRHWRRGLPRKQHLTCWHHMLERSIHFYMSGYSLMRDGSFRSTHAIAPSEKVPEKKKRNLWSWSAMLIPWNEKWKIPGWSFWGKWEDDLRYEAWLWGCPVDSKDTVTWCLLFWWLRSMLALLVLLAWQELS